MSKNEAIQIPEEVKPLLGTKQKIGGHVFSYKNKLPFEEYDVINWRFGTGRIVDLKTGKAKHPSFQLLLKKPGMRAARWSKGFPCRSIKLDDQD